MKKTVAWILCILMILAFVPEAFADGTVLPAPDALADDTVLVGIQGTFSENCEEILKELNRIRYQACYYGDPDPRNRERNLALADLSGGENPSDEVLMQANGDYVPAQWDSDLQRIAEIRAVEMSVSFSHTRPNGKSCFSLQINGTGSYNECLAYTNDAINSLYMYLGERQRWVEGSEGVTGHYTAMISPSILYYGIAGFRDLSGYGGGAALEASSRLGGSTTPIARSGNYTQIVELKTEFIDGAKINGEEAMQVNDTQTLQMLLQYGSYRTYLPYEPVTWESSDPGVLTVDGNGTVTALKSGTATISATFAEQTAALEITVTSSGGEEPSEERAGQCGDNVFWKLDGGVLTIYGEGPTWAYAEKDPAFYRFESEIREIVFEDGVTSVNAYLLYGLNHAKRLHLSATVGSYETGNGGLIGLETITVAPENTHFIVIDNVLYSENMQFLFLYASQKTDVEFRVPDGVVRILEAAVSSNNLRTVVLPQSLKVLEQTAFQGENLTDVYARGLSPECNVGSYVFGPSETITVHYPEWLKDSWAPNGETTWDIYRLAPYFSPVYSAVPDDRDVMFKGETPYVVYNGKAQTPRVVVHGADGSITAEDLYTVTYRDNKNPGTGYIDVQWKEGGPTLTVFFKIYLPGTSEMHVENRADGVRITWQPVEGAKGYVIYRRAWNLTSSGWTGFKRWNNTTDTAWTDTKVYAGTRYQYGIKAYFTDPTDSYNLGFVGPLKTTVRITSRTLLGVDPGDKEMTVRWSGSRYFTGYQIRYSTDPSFKPVAVSFKVARPDAYRSTIKNLVSGTTYYVQIRSYHEFEGMTYYGEWSDALSCKIK